MESCCAKKIESKVNVLNYMPLFSLTAVSILAGLAISYSTGDISMMPVMHGTMGVFLCILSLLKLFNLNSFADGFQKYDLLAGRTRFYALIYPFIELTLGLGYLSFIAPLIVYKATIVVMVFGSLGVLNAIRLKLDINCPCMGSILKAPVSTVTLVENMAMAVMAAYMLFII